MSLRLERRRRCNCPMPIPSCPDIAPEADPPRAPVPVPRPSGKRKVIAFPRPAAALPRYPTVWPTPWFRSSRAFWMYRRSWRRFRPLACSTDCNPCPMPSKPAVIPADHVELPFQAAYLSQRLYAGLIDCGIVAAAAGVFGAISYKMLPKFPLAKPVLIAAVGVLILLWAVYQYLFTMYGGATPGMQMLGIRLRTFKGGHLSWRHRRSRVIGLYFSAASLHDGPVLGLGGRGRPVLARPHQPDLPYEAGVVGCFRCPRTQTATRNWSADNSPANEYIQAGPTNVARPPPRCVGNSDTLMSSLCDSGMGDAAPKTREHLCLQCRRRRATYSGPQSKSSSPPR